MLYFIVIARIISVIGSWFQEVPGDNANCTDNTDPPHRLLERLDRAVRGRQVRSRNALVETALRHELAAMEEAAIDAELLGMAGDTDDQAEALALAEEFGSAEWRALGLPRPILRRGAARFTMPDSIRVPRGQNKRIPAR